MAVYFISDPHLGHKNIAKFRPIVSSMENNTEIFVNEWKKQRVKGKDVVYMLGDVAFTQETLRIIGGLPGRKILIKGNHDDYIKTSDQLEVFEEIYGMLRYKEFWLTHCPIHPDEMRGRKCNIHGHVHHKTVMTKTLWGSEKEHPKYLNVCVDNLHNVFGKWLVEIGEVRAYLEQRKQ